jgi:hypothetical protein
VHLQLEDNDVGIVERQRLKADGSARVDPPAHDRGELVLQPVGAPSAFR